MIIEDIIFNFHVRIKVVHSIPGRMRIHIPLVKKIPENLYLTAEEFDELQLIKGITSASFSYTTCNAIVQYDVTKTTEEKILESLKSIAKFAQQHKASLVQFKPEEKEEAFKYFIELVTPYIQKENL